MVNGVVEPAGEALKLIAEVQARRGARKSLGEWIKYRGSGYGPAEHHKLMIAELERIESGANDRLMFLLPPGSAKSTYGSVEFPTWYMGRNPKNSVIAASNTTDLAERFSRRVRNLCSEKSFRDVFGCGVSEDYAGAGKWETEAGGEYYAAGVGAAIAGRRADLAIIDDPTKSREDADSERSRDKQWEWYVNDLLTRLKPGAGVILIMCMVGNTQVLMADGSEKALRDIRPGDLVATNDDGRLTTAKVLNWINQGPDNVYEIRTHSGRIIKANGRHPFLVHRNGALEWIRLKDLKVADSLVCLRGHGLESSVGCATSRQSQKASATRTTTRPDGLRGYGRPHAIMSLSEPRTSDTDTGLKSSNTTNCLQRRTGSALFADSRPLNEIHGLGRGCTSASTTAMNQMSSGVCSATTATSQLEESEHRKSSKTQQNISDFDHDLIVSISPAGREDVFDIQVEGTENFIANGCTASNTRWHEDDLGGRILERERDRWKVIKIPMEAEEDDPLGREVGERLWKDWYTQEMLDLAKQDTRSWWALYQQNPHSEEGDYFKADWLIDYDSIPKGLRIYGASDFAVTEGTGDYTEHGIAGVDASGNMYLLDWWRGQRSADVWIDKMADMIERWQPACWFGEAGPIRRSVEPFMMKRLSERGAFCRVEWLTSIHDKESRARGIQAFMAMGKMFWPKFSGWKADVQGQLLKFPSGKHDDAVDVISLFGRGLKFINSSKVPVKKMVYRDLGLPGRMR